MRTGSGFALPGAQSAPASAAAASPEAIPALLAVQDEAASGRSQRETPLRRATLALEELRGLQLDLLRGGDDPARLARLATLSAGDDPGLDPALRSLLAEIRLRARVELARRHAQNAGGTTR